MVYLRLNYINPTIGGNEFPPPKQKRCEATHTKTLNY